MRRSVSMRSAVAATVAALVLGGFSVLSLHDAVASGGMSSFFKPFLADDVVLKKAGDTNLIIHANDDGATSDATLKFKVDSGSPAVKFTMGVDSGDSDKFKIEAADGLGGGSPALVVQSDGKIGIGNASPSSLLEVSGDMDISGDIQDDEQPANSFLRMDDDAWTYGSTNQVLLSAVNSMGFAIDTNNNTTSEYYTWGRDATDPGGTNWTEMMRLDHNGNLGLGASSPTAAIHVENGTTYASSGVSDAAIYAKGTHDNPIALVLDGAGSTDNKARVRFLNAGANKWQLNVDDDMHFYSATWTERLTLTSGGNVGIGQASPAEKLDVEGDIRVGDAMIIRNDNNIASASDIEILSNGVISAEQSLYINIDSDGNETANKLYIGTNALTSSATNLMVVQENGNVGIGSSSPGAMLDVKGHAIIGADATGNSYMTGRVQENYSDIGTTTSRSLYVYQVRDESSAATGTNYAYGIDNTLVARMTEDLVTPYHTRAYATRSVVYTDGTETFNWLRGADNIAYSSSTSATNQDSLAGSVNTAYLNAGGTLTSAYGAYNQAYNNNASGTIGTIRGTYSLAFTNKDGADVTTAYGIESRAYESVANPTGGITTAYGGYLWARDADTNYGVLGRAYPDDAETFGDAYGVYGDAYSNGASTVITNAYGIYGRAWESTGNVTNAYGGYFETTSAAGTNYALYATASGSGGTDYGIYVAAAEENYLATHLQVGAPGAGAESTDQAASTWTGDGYIETPWVYANAIEASDERGGASTLITVGTSGYTASDQIALITAGTERMTVLSDGNVGIGTDTAGAILEVNGNIIADDPTASSHVATKSYVDSAAGGGGTWTHVASLNSTDAASGYSADTYQLQDGVEYLIVGYYSSADFTLDSGDAISVIELCHATPSPNYHFDNTTVQANYTPGTEAIPQMDVRESGDGALGYIYTSSAAASSVYCFFTVEGTFLSSSTSTLKSVGIQQSTGTTRGTIYIRYDGLVRLYDSYTSYDVGVQIYSR